MTYISISIEFARQWKDGVNLLGNVSDPGAQYLLWISAVKEGA
jgi:hypothetical protein